MIVLIKNLQIVVFGLIIASLMLIVGILFTQNSKLQTSLARQRALPESIKSMENTEKSLFLIKDRLAKIKPLIKQVQGQETEKTITFLALEDPELTVSEIEIAPGKTLLSVQAKTADKAGSYLAQILTDPSYNKVTLNSFSFNPTSGYLVNLEILRK